MAQKEVIPNGVPIIAVEEVVIGSQFKFAVQFERLISEDPDVFEPLDFDGMTLKADVKDKPAKDILPDAQFQCTARITGDGWVDFLMDGDATGTLSQRTYEASFKVWPTGNPELGDTLLVFELPMVYKATR